MAAYMRGLFVLMITATLFAQEPPPRPRETKSNSSQSNKQRNNSSQQKSPSKTQRLLGSVPAPTTNPNGIEPAAKDKQQTTVDIRAMPRLIVEPVKDWTDWGIWLFSLLLAVVGILQVVILWRQTKIINDSLVETRKATELTRQTLVLTHRPRIIVRNFYFTETRGVGGIGHVPNGIEERSFAAGQFYIVNAGGTPAHVKEVLWRVHIERQLPLKRPYEGEIGGRVDVKLVPGQSTPHLFSFPTRLSNDLSMGLKNEEGLKLFVLGWIRYADELNIGRLTAFCRFYDTSKDRFIPVDDPDYEHAE